MIRHKAFEFVLFCLTLVGSSQQQVKADLFPLTIVHINDFHARFEATDSTGGTCDDGEICIGGYARTVYTVKRLLDEHKDTNPVYLNAGDSFQGTLWYNIGRWNVTSQFLNMLPADAMTLGNHEFDHGIEGVVPFLDALNTTMLVANMDSAKEPEMTGKYQKSMIIERSNRKIGVIGVILETTYNLANTGNLTFRNESEAIVEEAAKLKSQGVNIIIVISHCGYDVDKLIAEHAGSEIDVIVGSHSHTFLYTGDNPPGPDKPRGDYPTQVTHASGHRVLIVQAGAYAKYVGNLTVYFNDEGNVVDFEGAPIYMDNSVPQDPLVITALQPWKEEIDAQGKVKLGETLVDLEKYPCGSGECNLGNFFCDAMVHAYLDLAPYEDKAWTQVPIGLVNIGALRVPLYRGNLTYSHIVAMSPFENMLHAFDLPGERLLEALEFSASKIDYDNEVNSSYIFLQVSGLKVTYDFKRPMFERVIDLKVRCGKCSYPRYEPFNITSTYRIVAPNFLQDGGDGYSMLHDYGTNVQPYITDLDALLKYTKNISPITTGIEGRIRVLYSEIENILPTWKYIIYTAGSLKIGETKVNLEHRQCESKECNLGNFYTDALLHKLLTLAPFNSQNWANVSIALAAAGELSLTLPQGDTSVIEAIKPWHQEIAYFGNRVIGRSVVYLQQKECATGECNLGNFVTDAMLYAFLEEQNYDSTYWSNITIAFTAQSHFRVPLEAGNLTYNHLITMCPWENDIFVVTLNGSVIKQLLEDCIAPLTLESNYSYRFPQVSGLRVIFNITNPVGERVQELKVRCQYCKIPSYFEIDLNKNYKVVVMDYLANGKDGFNIIKDNAKDLRRGPGDIDAIIKFIEINDPVVVGIEGRLKIVY